MSDNTISLIDAAIVVIYILATTGFGSWFVKRSDSMDGFTLAGRVIPGWAIGLSLLILVRTWKAGALRLSEE